MVIHKTWICSAAAASLLGFCAASGQAQVVGEASAFGLEVDTQIVHLNTLVNVGVTGQLGPVPHVSGSAPPPFHLTDSLASASLSAGTLLNLGQGTIGANTGLLNVEAESDVGDPSGPPWTAQASASVSDFNTSVNLVGALSLANVANVFGFDASSLAISSHVLAWGEPGNFWAIGGSNILDASGASPGTLTFNVLGVAHDVTLDANGSVAPNTLLSISNVAGTSVGGLLDANLVGTINIHLNEQILTGDGVTGAGITVNAIRIEFDQVGAGLLNVLGITVDTTNLVTGEIIIAQSHAVLVPEPGSLAVGSLAGLLLLRRRRCAPEAL